MGQDSEALRESLRERYSGGKIVKAVSKALNIAEREILKPAEGRLKGTMHGN